MRKRLIGNFLAASPISPSLYLSDAVRRGRPCRRVSKTLCQSQSTKTHLYVPQVLAADGILGSDRS